MTEFKEGQRVAFTNPDSEECTGVIDFLLGELVAVALPSALCSSLDAVTNLRPIDEEPSPTELEKAKTRILELEALHTPRDTRKGQWPDEGQDIQVWDRFFGLWESSPQGSKIPDHYLWLPAPPAPEDS